MTTTETRSVAQGKVFAVAPMMDWTDRHCRYFHRQLTRHALLYTEMLTEAAIRHGDRQRLLGFDPREQPVALQIGGSNPRHLAEAARWSVDFGYVEINLNVGCPSERVQEGRFGACLMAEPELVRDCLGAMRDAVNIPVTVKCRIGVDDQDEEKDLDRFVTTVSQSGCKTIIIHARKAWLKGLSPKENREIPPLDHERVYRLKQARPGLTVILNGGITSLDDAKNHLAHVDGVMLGRAAYKTPWILHGVDPLFFGTEPPCLSPIEAAERMLPYVRQHLAAGGRLFQITRHMLGLFHGLPGGRLWRRILSEQTHQANAGAKILETALEAVSAAGEARKAA